MNESAVLTRETSTGEILISNTFGDRNVSNDCVLIEEIAPMAEQKITFEFVDLGPAGLPIIEEKKEHLELFYKWGKTDATWCYNFLSYFRSTAAFNLAQVSFVKR